MHPWTTAQQLNNHQVSKDLHLHHSCLPPLLMVQFANIFPHCLQYPNSLVVVAQLDVGYSHQHQSRHLLHTPILNTTAVALIGIILAGSVKTFESWEVVVFVVRLKSLNKVAGCVYIFAGHLNLLLITNCYYLIVVSFINFVLWSRLPLLSTFTQPLSFQHLYKDVFVFSLLLNVSGNKDCRTSPFSPPPFSSDLYLCFFFIILRTLLPFYSSYR